jgi:hypothetical protein
MKSKELLSSLQEEDNFTYIEKTLHDVVEKLSGVAYQCNLEMVPNAESLLKSVDSILKVEYDKCLRGIDSPDSKNKINPRLYLVRMKDILPLEGKVRESWRVQKFKDILLITLSHLIECFKTLRKNNPEKYSWVEIEKFIAPFLNITVKETE